MHNLSVNAETASQRALDLLRQLHPREKCRACGPNGFCYLHGVVLPDLAAVAQAEPALSPPPAPGPAAYADAWALRELQAVLEDAREYGDLPGHLVSWWNVVSGRTCPDDLVVPLKGAPDEHNESV